LGVVGFGAVSTPMPFVGTGVGIEDDDAAIAVAIGDVEFIGLGVDDRLGGEAQVLDVV